MRSNEKKSADRKQKLRDSDVSRNERDDYNSIHTDEIKRLNRVAGQVDGIRKMLESERELGDVLIQFKAVHSALRSIESRIFKNHVIECVDGIVNAERRKDREVRIEELLELYKQV